MIPGRAFRVIILIVLLSGFFRAGSALFAQGIGPERKPVKNLIILIADGAAAEQYTLARWFKGEPLALDRMLAGAVQTHSADSVVTDSAAAATAFATGHRTCNGFVGVGPAGPPLPGVPPPGPDHSGRPLATVLEGAKLLGKATGIVVTCRVTHATPAGFYAHVPSRSLENDIMEQGVYQNLDVMLGGGRRHLLPLLKGGRRTDGENLTAVLRERGYILVRDAEELRQVKSGKVFGLFADNHLEPEIDRTRYAPQQPTLEDMTRKAIELLSQDPDGFFLLVEGSQVDWACHANDPAHLLSDLLMFDRAVQAALDFAGQDGNTLVVALSDHNCGGLTIGNRATNGIYGHLSPDALLEPLRRMKLSARGLCRELGADPSPAKIREVVEKFWGIRPSDNEAGEILALARKYGGHPQDAFGEVICPKYTAIGWTTHGHCGGDVPLFAFGPRRPEGLLEAPAVGRACAQALGLSLEQLNARLFQDADKVLPGGRVAVDRSEPENPVVQITLPGKVAELPVNKNLLRLNGKTISLEGVVVYAPDTGKAYIPLEAVHRLIGRPEPLPAVSEK